MLDGVLDGMFDGRATRTRLGVAGGFELLELLVALQRARIKKAVRHCGERLVTVRIEPFLVVLSAAFLSAVFITTDIKTTIAKTTSTGQSCAHWTSHLNVYVSFVSRLPCVERVLLDAA